MKEAENLLIKGLLNKTKIGAIGAICGFCSPSLSLCVSVRKSIRLYA
jgi:hypothetical protein